VQRFAGSPAALAFAEIVRPILANLHRGKKPAPAGKA
jgi:hypothetical protein